jgi:hypothetical protein
VANDRVEGLAWLLRAADPGFETADAKLKELGVKS